jgi:hypothetical protein
VATIARCRLRDLGMHRLVVAKQQSPQGKILVDFVLKRRCLHLQIHAASLHV